MDEINEQNQQITQETNNQPQYKVDELASQLLEAQNKNKELSNNLSQQGKLINESASKVKSLESEKEELLAQVKALTEQLNSSNEIKAKYDALIQKQTLDEVAKVVEILRQNNVPQDKVNETLAGIKSTYGIDLVANRNLATAETLIKAYVSNNQQVLGTNPYNIPNNGGYNTTLIQTNNQQPQPYVAQMNDADAKKVEAKRQKMLEMYGTTKF